jgi:hypothetical protein
VRTMHTTIEHYTNPRFCTLAKIAYNSSYFKANTPNEWTQKAHRCHRGVLAPWHDGRREEE